MIDQTRPSAHVNIHRCILIILSCRNVNVYSYLQPFSAGIVGSTFTYILYSHRSSTSLSQLLIVIVIYLLVRAFDPQPSDSSPPSSISHIHLFVHSYGMLICYRCSDVWSVVVVLGRCISLCFEHIIINMDNCL